MSWTPNYGHDNVLSKIKLGEGANDVKYLKDADLRAIVEGFNENIIKGQIGAMNEQDKFVYSQNIKAYVDSAIKIGVTIVVPESGVLPAASAYTEGKIYLIPQTPGKTNDNYDEYITVRSGEQEPYTYAWEKIGDTRIDLSGYLTDINYVDNTHTLTETKGGSTTNVHTFGDLADADTASTSYTPAGTISPFTTISTVGTSASFTQGVDSFDEGTLPSIDESEFDGGSLTNFSVVLTDGSVEIESLNTEIHVGEDFLYGGTWPTFSQGSDTFTAGTLPTKASDTFSAGTLPTFTPSSQSFATAGVTVAVDTSDTEMLVFSAAGTDPALTPSTAFSQGTLPSFTEGAFTQGTLPSFTQGTDSYSTANANFPYISESDIWAETNGNITYTSQEVSSVTFDFTPASIGSDFFNPGTLPSFEQGEDTFTANSLPTTKTTTPTFTGSSVTITVSADAE